jgi:membrane associated rhomboid family serine protease
VSWQDRPYARSDVNNGFTGSAPSVASRWSTSSVVTKLIIINVALFVLTFLTGQNGHPEFSRIFLWLAMVSEKVASGQIWRVVTSAYLHFGFMHILFNMYGLWLFGSMLERTIGGRLFFIMYVMSGLVGSLLYLALGFTGIVETGIAAGASGCVLGTVGACAVMFPNRRLHFWGLFPVTIRAMGIIYGLIAAMVILQNGYNAAGEACHLGGLLFGAWFATQINQSWMRKLQGTRGRFSSAGIADVVSTMKSKISRPPDDAEVDRILLKIRERGIQSLSKREKGILADASNRQRQGSVTRHSKHS